MAIVVMICFARSGGTVLNQCLGMLPNVVILWEVNPLGGGWGARGSESPTTVKEQAKRWYRIDLASEGFSNNILELERICEATGKRLLVRDWSFVNFVPCKENMHNPPSSLLTLDDLNGKCETIPFAFVRDSIDVWISRGGVSDGDFFRYYRCYIEEIKRRMLPVYKYESFCRHPDKVIREICKYTGLEFSDSFRQFQSFMNVNGDTQIAKASRSSKHNKIAQLRRRLIPRETITFLNGNADMKWANNLMGYPVSYFGRPREIRWLSKVWTVLKNVKRPREI